MFSKLVALSTVSVTLAATGNVTALCAALLDTAGCGAAATAQFPAPAPTLAQCETLFTTAVPTLGDDTNTTGNNIGCRTYWATQAKSTNMTWKCKFAGFTGGGVCQDSGTGVLTSACNAIDAACTGRTPYYPYASAAACVAELGPNGADNRLAAIWGSNQGTAAASENSLECRVYHALVGWNNGVSAGSDFHCGHTTFLSNATFCGGGVATHAEHYCTSVMSTACAAPATQYGGMAICVNTFNTFPNGNATDSDNRNNRGCRQYHAQAAVTLGNNIHCYHGGPSGGAVCGGVGGGREAWQIMTTNANCQGNNSWVATSVGLAFQAWAPADLLAIVPAADYSKYNTTAFLDTNTDICRLYHLTVSTTAADHCSHGSLGGAGQCGNITTVICGLIAQACSSNYATPADCAADIMPLLAKPGDPSQVVPATPPVDDSLQCRVYYAGVALVAKKNGTSTTSMCANAKNNGSVACTGPPAPTSGASMVAASMMALVTSALVL